MPQKQQPFWYGGAASIVAGTCTHPLDLAKARMQAAHKPEGNMFKMLYKIIKSEGFFAIYDGLSASILRQATYSTTRFGVYEWLKEKITKKDGSTPPVYVLLPISMIAGLAGSLVGNPADVANVRMQNDRTLPLAKRRNYGNALDGVYQIYRSEGWRALFRGVGPNCIRGVLMTASQVVSYDVAKTWLVHKLDFDPHARGTFFAASIIAGLVATTVCSPVDVIKTRAMNAHVHEPPLQVIKHALQHEGIKFLFRGWTPAFIRLAPQTIVTFLVLEQLKKWGGFN